MTKQTISATASPWLYRYSVLVAACALLLLLSGAYITTSEEQATSIDQSVFAGTGHVRALEAIFTAQNHTLLAIAIGILTTALVTWLMVAANGGALRLLGVAAIAIFALDGWLGSRGTPQLSRLIGGIHAVLAHLFFSLMVMIAVFTSSRWKREPEFVDDGGHTSLRGLALAAPFLVLLQIALGASYRHGILEVLPHIVGAFAATAVILLVCLTVTQDFADHRSLNSTAIALLCIILTQISLGIATFTMRLQHLEDTSVFLFSSMLHVMVGSLTLAATVVMAMQVRRNVRRSEEQVDASASEIRATQD